MTKRIIVWLRNDLSIRDNEILFRASEKGTVYPVYCFDPRQFQKNELGFPKTGAFRAEFLLTSLANLRKNLKNIGGHLIIRQGLPEKIIPQLADLLHADAVYASKDLAVNWTWGASYFESQLIDYDVCSNWGNWNYVAGVGNDPRENRYFNIMSQAIRYDPQGDYVRHWLPELAQISGRKIHYPAELSEAELLAAGVQIGKNYPEPMVDFQKWLY